MSLDIWLTIKGTPEQAQSEPGIFIREGGRIQKISRDEWDLLHPDREPVVTNSDIDLEGNEVYEGNITHNLAQMAEEADLYKYLWRPDEIGITQASQLIEPLQAGLDLLKSDPDRFKQFNPPNGWGDYEGLVSFVEEYLTACRAYPTAEVSTWR